MYNLYLSKVQFRGLFADLQGLGTLFCSLPVQRPGRLGKCLGNLGATRQINVGTPLLLRPSIICFGGRLMQDQRS